MSKIKKMLSSIRHLNRYVNQKSYYPEDLHKSKNEIIRDQIRSILKYGEAEPFYYLYGFDRKSANKDFMSQYITPYDEFESKINLNNKRKPYSSAQKGYNVNQCLHGRTLTANKYYFGTILEKLGYPVPRMLCFISRGEIKYLINKDRSEYVDGDVRTVLADFLKCDMDAFCKPAGGQLGQGIFSLKVSEGKIFVAGKETKSDDTIDLLLSNDYLVQDRLVQHEALKRLNDSCFNTIRLQTVQTPEGDIIPFGPVLRIGKKGCEVDNWAKGGICVGIDMNTGKLMDKGFLKPAYGTVVTKHPDSGIVFEGYEIPFFKEAVKVACSAHSQLFHSHSIGWDIAITPNGPAFIEANGLWEISLIQAAHGGLKKEIERYFNI